MHGGNNLDNIKPKKRQHDLIDPNSRLTEKEHYQTFGYLRGTGWPVAILVNFGAGPKAQIERFYNNEGTIEVF